MRRANHRVTEDTEEKRQEERMNEQDSTIHAVVFSVSSVTLWLALLRLIRKGSGEWKIAASLARKDRCTMPTYEYECDACQHRFEEFQSMKDKALKKCPKCTAPKLRRLFGTGAAILFKGSGFYETDYRSESYKSAAKADADAGKPAGKTDTASTNGSAGSPPASSGGESGGKASTS
jgi:putative FmdB family regulatory protein